MLGALVGDRHVRTLRLDRVEQGAAQQVERRVHTDHLYLPLTFAIPGAHPATTG